MIVMHLMNATSTSIGDWNVQKYDMAKYLSYQKFANISVCWEFENSTISKKLLCSKRFLNHSNLPTRGCLLLVVSNMSTSHPNRQGRFSNSAIVTTTNNNYSRFHL